MQDRGFELYCTFCSSWDEGVIETPAFVNTASGEVTVQVVEADCEGLGLLERQFIVIDDIEYLIDEDAWEGRGELVLTPLSLARLRSRVSLEAA